MGLMVKKLIEHIDEAEQFFENESEIAHEYCNRKLKLGVMADKLIKHLKWAEAVAEHRLLYDEREILKNWATPKKRLQTSTARALKHCSTSRKYTRSASFCLGARTDLWSYLTTLTA